MAYLNKTYDGYGSNAYLGCVLEIMMKIPPCSDKRQGNRHLSNSRETAIIGGA
jgi:hypothetical protein